MELVIGVGILAGCGLVLVGSTIASHLRHRHDTKSSCATGCSQKTRKSFIRFQLDRAHPSIIMGGEEAPLPDDLLDDSQYSHASLSSTQDGMSAPHPSPRSSRGSEHDSHAASGRPNCASRIRKLNPLKRQRAALSVEPGADNRSRSRLHGLNPLKRRRAVDDVGNLPSSSIPVVRVAGVPLPRRRSLGSGFGEFCSICLEEFENGEDLTLLPCKHLYHTECVEPWLSSHHSCCVCKVDLEALAKEVRRQRSKFRRALASNAARPQSAPTH